MGHNFFEINAHLNLYMSLVVKFGVGFKNHNMQTHRSWFTVELRGAVEEDNSDEIPMLQRPKFIKQMCIA